MTIQHANDTPAQEEIDLTDQVREAEQVRRDLEIQGWVWRGTNGIDKRLCHPDDPDMFIWFDPDPYTGEQLLSLKLLDRLADDVRRGRALPSPE